MEEDEKEEKEGKAEIERQRRVLFDKIKQPASTITRAHLRFCAIGASSRYGRVMNAGFSPLF